MRLRWLALFLALVVSAGTPAALAAQGTPPATDGGAAVSQPVTIYNGQGVEAAQIAVTEVTDPFEDWAEFLAPQVGERYVVVTVQITNTGERPFQFEPFDFYLRDSVGRLYTGGIPFRSPQSVAQIPDLAGASMLPGETITGALTYTIPADAVVAQVIYMGTLTEPLLTSYQHLFILADLRPGTP